MYGITQEDGNQWSEKSYNQRTVSILYTVDLSAHSTHLPFPVSLPWIPA